MPYEKPEDARVLVTGATGFVGAALVRRLLDERIGTVVTSSRKSKAPSSDRVLPMQVTDLCSQTQWDHALEGVSTVFHLAARVHVMHDTSTSPLEEFRHVNVAGTLALACSAVRAGATRFVFVSSIKVNGESTDGQLPFAADDAPAPSDPYGISKLEAEVALRKLAADTGIEVVIVRPPLVYGPGVKANFRKMMNWLACGVPLPFGAIDNRRSLVSLGNLVDLLALCGRDARAANQTFLASDGNDLSTTMLLRGLSEAMQRPARLVPVPPSLLRAAFGLLGKGDLAVRLCGSLEIDLAKTRSVLGWTPPVLVPEALAATVEAFLSDSAGSSVAKSGASIKSLV